MTDYFHLNAAPDTVRAISSLGLAHLGDGVFELMVRSWLCLHGKATSKGLHRATVRYVAAPAQARAVERILPLLTGEEGDVFRRGRNTSPHSVPQNASRADYQAATGLEALFGWLWLQGRTERHCASRRWPRSSVPPWPEARLTSSTSPPGTRWCFMYGGRGRTCACSSPPTPAIPGPT